MRRQQIDENSVLVWEVLIERPDDATRRGLGPEELLRAVARSTLRLHTDEPELHHVLLHDAPRSAAVTKRLHELEDGVADAVVTLLARLGSVPPARRRRAAYVLVHVLENLAHEYVVHPPREE